MTMGDGTGEPPATAALPTPAAGVASEEMVALRRQRLLLAAAAVVADKGYDGTTVREVASRVGLTTGAIYRQWGSKAGLLLAVFRICRDDLVTSLARAADTGHRLFDIAMWLVKPRPALRRQLVFESFVAARRHQEFGQALRGEMRGHDEMLEAVIERDQRRGLIDPDISRKELARFCREMSAGKLVLDEVDPTSGDPVAREYLIRRLFEGLAPAAVDCGDQVAPAGVA